MSRKFFPFFRGRAVEVFQLPRGDHAAEKGAAMLLETIERMEAGTITATPQNAGHVQPVEGIVHDAAVISPIIASGDVMGAVVMLTSENMKVPSSTEIKLAQSAAAFLGKQMEN